jgi:hypothetical protein
MPTVGTERDCKYEATVALKPLNLSPVGYVE